MSVVKKYLSRQKLDLQNISAPEKGLKMVVVIPCFMEPDITTTLLSLWHTEPVDCVVEIIVVVNSSERSSDQQIEFNRQTYRQLIKFAKVHQRKGVRFLPILIEGASRKHAGVGLARKTGMDLALQRFVQVDQPNGILVSLDADTLVSQNYLSAICHFFCKHPKAVGANLAFAHKKMASSNNPNVYLATLTYELYLRYFRQALKFTGFPYAHHTIGSCFTISAEAYAKVGGMPRKQAGEDFYLLHKLFPMGHFGEIVKASVFPAARESDRVPFGTGPMVTRVLQNNSQLSTYPLDLFLCLKRFFEVWPILFNQPKTDLSSLGLDTRLLQFLKTQKFEQELWRVSQNSASEETFVKQLFAAFNAFKVIQFLNETTVLASDKNDVLVESVRLLKALGVDAFGTDVRSLLAIFRGIDDGGFSADY